MRRKKGPALYELIRPGPSSSSDGQGTPGSPSGGGGDGPDLERNLLTPGRSIRMSIGGLAVAGALIVAIMVVIYAMGYQRGEATARSDYANRLLADLPVDPVQAAGGVATLPDRPPAPIRPRTWGPVESDPRQGGQYYFVVAQSPRKWALPLVDFCRDQGLETYVISGNNAGSSRVIALPGLPSDNRSDAAVRELEDRIRAAGRLWKERGGTTDLHDAYLSLYRGS